MLEFRGSSVCAKLHGRRYKLSVTQQPPAETTASPAQRIGWAVLILVTLYICYFSHLGVIGFVGPDEPRYAWIARDMAESGDWVTPRLYGKPWFEKPPLLYWGGAIFFKLGGDRTPEVAARLPSAISALFATLALAWLAWRTYGEECARWLLLLLPTSVGMIGFSHAAATDMPFAGMLTIAMVCAAVALGLVDNEDTSILPHTPWRALLLFGFFLGLAALAKGPAAIILSGGALFFWAIFTKRWRAAFRLLHPAAIAAFCMTALPWYILCARRNPDFFRVFIIEHNFKRYLTPEFQHIQPFWFYGPAIFIAILPWTAAFLYSEIAGTVVLFKNRAVSPVTALVLCWAVFPLIFFSISRSKLPGYILPAIPAMALLVVRFMGRFGLERRKQLGRVFLLFAGFCMVSAEILDRTHHTLSSGMIGQLIISMLLYLIAIVNVMLAFAFLCIGKSWVKNIAFALGAIPILVVLGTVNPQSFLSDFSGLSSSATARHLQNRRVPLENLYVDATVPRSLRYGLNFYLHREVPDWDENRDEQAHVLSRSQHCVQLRSRGYSCSNIELGSEVRGWFLSQITPADSLDRPSGGRQPQQKE